MAKDRLARGTLEPCDGLVNIVVLLLERMRKIPTGCNCGVELEPCHNQGRKLTTFNG